MAAASDEQVFSLAEAEDRVLISADTDFGTILALRNKAHPSVILLRVSNKQTAHISGLIVANIDALAEALQRGCVAVIEDGRIRLRQLPIGSQ